jgi:hypothetical protein
MLNRMKWYISDSGDVRGPVSGADVRHEIKTGHVRAGMHVRDEDSKWIPIEQSPFQHLLTTDKPAPPTVTQQALRFLVGAALVLTAFVYCSNAARRQIEKNTAEVNDCTARGVNYFKEIGSYPRLTAEPNAGREAEVVARERCTRTTRAFP